MVGEGIIEMQQTRPYEFGDSLHRHGHPRLAHQRHAPQRAGPARAHEAEDILVHRTRNTPKCATVVLLDMSGSMRYNGLYIDVTAARNGPGVPLAFRNGVRLPSTT